MGWESSNRRSKLPANWPELRKEVRARSGGRCEVVVDGKRCQNRAVDVDHVNRGNDHSLSNLRDICEPHHDAKSSREGVEARAMQKARVSAKFRRTDERFF